MSTKLSLTLGLTLLFPPLSTAAQAHSPLVVDSEPLEVQPYVIPYLNGFGVQFDGYAIQFPVTNVSTAGAVSLISIRGATAPEDSVPVHIHTRYHETFFVAKGAINLWAFNESRRLGPLDIGSVPPNTDHSFQLLEPDTEIVGAVTPGGFSFYQQIGNPYDPQVLTTFPTDDANLTIDEPRVAANSGLKYDYNPTNYTLNYNQNNGTTNPNQPWHDGNNTLPGSLTPYYVAGGWGPKYLHRGLGRVTHLYMTGRETNNVMTIATVTMRASRTNETCILSRSDISSQLLRPLEGQLHVRMAGQTTAVNTGDTAVVPPGVDFVYWSEAPFTRFYTVAAVPPGTKLNSTTKGATNASVDETLLESTYGLAHDLLRESVPWDYAVFPDHY